MNTTNLLEMDQVQAVEVAVEEARELSVAELALVGGGFDLMSDV